MRAYCLTCEMTIEASELAQAAWYGLDMLGCEEESLGNDKVRLKCYFKNSISLHSAEFSLMDICPSLPVTITVIADQDWNANWKKNMKPVTVANGIWVSPAWLKPPMQPDDVWIKIEPKMAFGTGHHETTRLASAGILGCKKYVSKTWHMLDIGTGSGILSFIGDCLGATYALGVDLDPVCGPNLAENKRKNKIAGRVNFAIGSITMLSTSQFFDLVVMNMISAEGMPLISRIASLLKPGAYFVWSGLLLDEKKYITQTILPFGFHLKSDAFENEWWCGTFEKR